MQRGVAAWVGWVLLAGCASAPVPATEEDLTALEPAALAGDRAAIRALFDLRRRCDGAVAEINDMILGSTIRPWPRLFLEELHRYESGSTTHLGGILGNMGPERVDEFELQQREALLRIAALQSVRRPELAELRDRCIANLRSDASRAAPREVEQPAANDAEGTRRTVARLTVHGTDGRAVLSALRAAHPGVVDAELRDALQPIAAGAPSPASVAAAAALCALAGIEPLAVAERRYHAREQLTEPQWFAWIAGYGYHWICSAGMTACYFEFDERQFADRVRVYETIGAGEAAAAMRAADRAFGASGVPASLEDRLDVSRATPAIRAALQPASARFQACGDEIFTRVLLYCLEHAAHFRA